MFTNTPSLGYFTSVGFTSPHFCYRRSRVNWLQKFRGKNWKNKRFLLTLVQQLQPTGILHCSKQLQNIKINISCDISLYICLLGRYYDQGRSQALTHPPYWIWAFRVSSHTQSYVFQNGPLYQRRQGFILYSSCSVFVS